MERCNVVWFDHDFRIDDQPALTAACEDGLPVVALYVDTLHNASRQYDGFVARSTLQQQALYNVLYELKTVLQECGIELLVFTNVNDAFTILRQHIVINKVYALTPRALNEAQRFQQAKRTYNLELILLAGRTMLMKEAWMSPMPKVFTAFRKKLETQGSYRPSATPPKPTPPLRLDLVDHLETLNKHIEIPFDVGINAAKQRLSYYLTSSLVTTYKETRNGMLHYDDSSKLSIHLAMGCLSATMVHEALATYENTVMKNESTYWLRFELWWREFFYLLQEESPNIYAKVQPGYRTNESLIESWIHGQTGYPLVDAAMRELLATGYMSNRARQNVASFFVHYLKQDWRIGADYFASTLLDYDPSSNYLNWQYVAGVGNDPRDQRIFNVHKQGRDYDPQGAYVYRWIPELATISVALLYPKSPLTPQEAKSLRACGYPDPVVRMPF
jgi:deoxyribodipyrimidine photo-lyase